ncbi:MAG: glycogen debranching enzyme family protein [Clostridia bacterium]|nr:glycogen debranching enzyme family protein [Clostridia bacterium]
MKYLDKELSLKDALEKEWLITNGIGGYASSTVIGANTRKYHGLLIAALTPPARRHLILSKLDESIEINGKSHVLYTNICKNYISEGFKLQKNFEKAYIPIFTYEVNGIIIKKIICMKYRENTVCILYKITTKDEDAKLNITPVINFRDFHCMNTGKYYDLKQEVKDQKVKIIVDNMGMNPIYIYASEGNYNQHYNDTFNNMYYLEEEKRGFFPEENHAVPGTFTVEIPANEEKEISIICSLESNIEEINIKDVINEQIKRLENMVYESNLVWENKKDTQEQIEEKKFIKDLVMSTDDFIVYRPTFGLHTVIAGYHWFLDWGRDALIAYEGLLLKTRRFEIAKQVLLTFTRNIKFGLVPNGYSGYDNRPLYNSVDSSLLLFEQIKKYLIYTGDYVFVKRELYEILKKIIESYKVGIDLDDNNIYLDEDNLIVSGTDHTQNTWMDAKYGDFAVTPRNGKAVEINALWYNALNIMAELCTKYGEKADAEIYLQMASKTKKSFEEKFYNSKRKCLYDVLGDSKIRPNQLFSFSLTYPVIDPNGEIAQNVLKVVESKLLNKYGLKTLAKGEKGYVDIYEGNGFKRDMSYHQGITWPWLLGLYNNCLLNQLKAQKDKKEKSELIEKYLEFANETEKTFKKEFYYNGGIYSISEIYDSKTPFLPKGTIAQAWSVAEILRIILNKKEVENENFRN